MQGARGRWKASSQLFPGGQTQLLRYLLSSAQIKTLNSVGLLGLVPDPGAGKVVIVDALTFEFLYPASGGVQYTGGGEITLQYHGTSTNVLSDGVAATVIQAAASAVQHFIAAATAGGIVVPVAHVGLDLVAGTADFAAGNGTAKVFIQTRILEL